MRKKKLTLKDYLSLKYENPHKHVWFSVFGAPKRCYLCGIGKEIHEQKIKKIP